jgi:hypothetical protein
MIAKGPIRIWVEVLMTWSRASGLSLEDTADLFDRVQAIRGPRDVATTDETPGRPPTLPPAKGTH